jgi:hypothetical protein
MVLQAAGTTHNVEDWADASTVERTQAGVDGDGCQQAPSHPACACGRMP